MTPAAGDFEMFVNMDHEIELTCPECGGTVATDAFFSIRDLIAAASEHARTAHAMSEVNA